MQSANTQPPINNSLPHTSRQSDVHTASVASTMDVVGSTGSTAVDTGRTCLSLVGAYIITG